MAYALGVWTAEVEEYVWTMVNELVTSSEKVHPALEEVLDFDEGQAREGRPQILVSQEADSKSLPTLKVHVATAEKAGTFIQDCQLHRGDRKDAYKQRRKDIQEQIQKIREVLLMNRQEEMLTDEDTFELKTVECRRVIGTLSQVERIGQKSFQQSSLEPSGKAQKVKQEGPVGEIVSEGGCLANWYQISEFSKHAQEMPHEEEATNELEVDRLSCQVQFLVHQLTTCRQNLLKAELEVSMLHDENLEFRSLIRDILAAFSNV